MLRRYNYAQQDSGNNAYRGRGQAVAASCLGDRGRMFDRSRPVFWSIAASCLDDRDQLFGRSRPDVRSMAAAFWFL
jgi:hypothetical protein